MSIAISEVHRDLAETAQAFATDRKVLHEARSMLEGEHDRRPPFWDEMAKLGWLGLHLPEQFGGSGFGLPELVVVIEQLAREVAPGPFVPTVVASALLAAAGTPEQQARWLPGLADGSVAAAVGLGGELTLSGGKVSGDAGVVLGGAVADLLLLRAGDDLVVLEAATPKVTVVRPHNVDPRDRVPGSASTLSASVASVLAGARDLALALARTLFAAGGNRARPRRRRPRPPSTPRNVSSSDGRSGRSRRSSTTAPTCSSQPSSPPHPPGTPHGRPKQGAISSCCRRPSRPLWRSPRPCRTPSSTSRFTGASGSPGSTTPTCCCAAPWRSRPSSTAAPPRRTSPPWRHGVSTVK